MIAILLDHSSFEMKASSFTEHPLNLNKNLEDMAKYYFVQGGKLFRPTISLLMSSVCNQQVAQYFF